MTRRRIGYLLSLALIATATLDPVVLSKVPSVEYLFVFDISLSMRVPDEQDQSRLEAAKAMVLRALGELPLGARVSIGAFVGTDIQILLRSKPIQDREAIEKALELVRWDNAWATGSWLGWAIDQLANEATQKWGLPKPLNVFIFTDGGDGGVPAYADSLRKRIRGNAMRVTFVGMGDPLPSPVPGLTPQEGCLRRPDRQDCFQSALNEPALQEFASSLMGYYVRARKYIGNEHALFSRHVLLGEPTSVPRPVGHLLAASALAIFLLGVVL